MTADPHALDAPLGFLQRANPIPQAPLTAGLDGALARVADEIARQPYAAPRQRSGRRRTFHPRAKLVLAVGIAALTVGGVATAAVALHAYTGIFASGPNASAGGPGEELNMAAPDFRGAALELSSDIRYPDGYGSWRDFVVQEQAPGPGGAGTGDQVTTGALRGWFAASAFCAWVQDWRGAVRDGNSVEANRAANAISAAPDWSAVSAEDPSPSPSRPNDPGAEPGTLFGWLLPYRSAVLAGDPSAVDQMLANGYGGGKCWLADPQWMSELRTHDAWSSLSPKAFAQRYERFLARRHS